MSDCRICSQPTFRSPTPHNGYYKVKSNNEVKPAQIDLDEERFHKKCAKCSVCKTYLLQDNFYKDESTGTLVLYCLEHSPNNTNNGNQINQNDPPSLSLEDPLLSAPKDTPTPSAKSEQADSPRSPSPPTSVINEDIASSPVSAPVPPPLPPSPPSKPSKPSKAVKPSTSNDNLATDTVPVPPPVVSPRLPEVSREDEVKDSTPIETTIESIAPAIVEPAYVEPVTTVPEPTHNVPKLAAVTEPQVEATPAPLSNRPPEPPRTPKQLSSRELFTTPVPDSPLMIPPEPTTPAEPTSESVSGLMSPASTARGMGDGVIGKMSQMADEHSSQGSYEMAEGL